MKDDSCIRFLQWALPRLYMRWPGFRKVRGQVCKRLGRRLEELQLADLEKYRMYLEDNPPEWHILDSLCRITISRFYRDREIFDTLRVRIFPELIDNLCRRDETILSCWCIGAASGEEPYTVSLMWSLSGLPGKNLDCKILATEIDQHMINRAVKGCYSASSIRELPPEVTDRAFSHDNARFCLKEKFKNRVKFLRQDIRKDLPDSTFDLIFCRNLVFTYFSLELQEEITRKILLRLKPGGFFIIGGHEKLPDATPNLIPWMEGKKIYQKVRGED